MYTYLELRRKGRGSFYPLQWKLNFSIFALQQKVGQAEKAPLHHIVLTCGHPNSGGLICNLGKFRESGPNFHKVLDESDMFMLQIDIRAPLHFLCAKFLVKVKPVQSYMLEGHH